MKQEWSIAISLAAITFLGTGCTQQVLLPPDLSCNFTPMLQAMRQPGLALVPAVPGTMTEIPLNSVSMTDVSITNKVLVQSTFARRTPTQTVEVHARFMNCTDFPLQIEGRTQFFDEAQVSVEPPSAWHRVYVSARSVGTYIESSTDARRVATYLIELREGR